MQVPGESVADYVAELKRLATCCEFGDHLEETLRDQLVCGMHNQGILKRLLAEPDLTYAKAVEVASGMEVAEKTTQRLRGPELAVQHLGKTKGSQSAKSSSQGQCYRCGSTKHAAATCKFREVICHHCQKRGHIAKVCRSRKQGTGPAQGQRPSQNRMHHTTMDSQEGALPLFHLGVRNSDPITVDVSVDGKIIKMEVDTGAVKMEVDTGAAVSLITEQQQQELFPTAVLSHSKVTLRTYTAERLPVVGEMHVHVQYGDQTSNLPLLVVRGVGPALLGGKRLVTTHLPGLGQDCLQYD